MARRIFAAGIEHENLAGLRIGHVDIVLRVDRHALRREHRIFPGVAPRNELIFLLVEIEDVNSGRPPRR